jgi:hypothetical protein
MQLLSLYHPPQALRRALSNNASAINATAAICSPQITSNAPPGASDNEANNGRSVGAGRGAGGVNREADTLVGKASAMAVGGGVDVDVAVTLVTTASAVGEGGFAVEVG